MKTVTRFIVLLVLILCPVSQAHAIVDPLAVPNNKFGIHLISATPNEASPAADLVNSSGGDWGYVTVLIRSDQRDTSTWQTVFNDFRVRHLIPIIRLATQAEGGNWKRPYDGEEHAWADFLDTLVWPTKNRYVTIYNEPNQGQEWAGTVDAADYARTLDKTITALKNKNSDFFVLNGGLDASAPNKMPLFGDETEFLRVMNETVPGIFNKLDGWASHSYPNPGFVGSPDASGRGTVRTWLWETQILRSLGLTKNLPIFITETGWKHAEGLDFDKSLPISDVVADYYKRAFQSAWSADRIVAVTPFLLNYQEKPFDHFSFTKLTGQVQNEKILGVSESAFYPAYHTLTSQSKSAGVPIQENRAQWIRGEIYPSLVTGENYTFSITFKNTGQSIWGERGSVNLVATQGQKELGILPVSMPESARIEPGQEQTFLVKIKAPESGIYSINLQLYNGNQLFDSGSLQRTIEIKSPVKFIIESALKWKNDPSGEYLLTIASDVINTTSNIMLDQEGRSVMIEDRHLVPDHDYDFILQKPNYQPKTLHVQIKSGDNTLNFGSLEPDFMSVLFKPLEFIKLLPFSQ